MKLTLFGAGYVGLVTGACFSDVGHDVVCVDIDEHKIHTLNEGKVPIFEPGLENVIARNLAAGRIAFTTKVKEAIDFADVIFITVGTPPEEDGSADLSHVLSVATTIGSFMQGYKLIVNKSTVPIGTADKVRDCINEQLAKRKKSYTFDVCSNPEFLKEGAAIEDFTRAARFVIGTDSDTVRNIMRSCYAPLNRNHDKLMFMDTRSAEMTKYAANAMLATRISFMNEIAALAERVEADIENVRVGIGSDPRIGYDFLYPGCGYGGSCFPKDVKALIRTACENDIEPHVLNAVEKVNDRQKTRLYEKLYTALDGDLKGRTIAVWGLSFKPDTDDMREAPSRVLIEQLFQAGARVRSYDPQAGKKAHEIFGGRPEFSLAEDRTAAVKEADALVICTEWKEFRSIDFKILSAHLKQGVIVDGRNMYDPEELCALGLKYYAIGRGTRA